MWSYTSCHMLAVMYSECKQFDSLANTWSVKSLCAGKVSLIIMAENYIMWVPWVTEAAATPSIDPPYKHSFLYIPLQQLTRFFFIWSPSDTILRILMKRTEVALIGCLLLRKSIDRGGVIYLGEAGGLMNIIPPYMPTYGNSWPRCLFTQTQARWWFQVMITSTSWGCIALLSVAGLLYISFEPLTLLCGNLGMLLYRELALWMLIKQFVFLLSCTLLGYLSCDLFQDIGSVHYHVIMWTPLLIKVPYLGYPAKKSI